MTLDRIGAITLFVDDPARSKEFYGRVFDAALEYEDENSAVFGFSGVLVNVLKRTGADTLVEPAAVGRAPALLLTIWVDDADATCAELRDRGVELLNGPVDRAWGVRTAAFADPDGHVWEIAQRL